MCSLLFVMDHQSFSRYATIYFLNILNLKNSHSPAELLRHEELRVLRSTVSSCRVAVGQTIEQTINCHAKTAGGIIGFGRNSAAYLRWCTNFFFCCNTLDGWNARG